MFKKNKKSKPKYRKFPNSYTPWITHNGKFHDVIPDLQAFKYRYLLLYLGLKTHKCDGRHAFPIYKFFHNFGYFQRLYNQ